MTVFDNLSRISAENLPQFTIIFGENKAIISELKSQLLNKVNFDSSDLSQAYFDLSESDGDLALEELESLPFFGDEMLVVFENLWDLTTTKKSVFNDKQLTRLEDYLDNPLDSTKAIFVFHGKLDGKRRIVKKLRKVAVELEASELKPQELTKYFVANSGLQPNIVNLIIEKSNANFAIVKQNIDLVKTYANGRDITPNDVIAAVPKSLSDNIFDLTDLILKGKLATARALVSDLVLQGEDEIKLLAILTNNFRLYYQIKILLNKNYADKQIIEFLKINPFRLKFLLAPARKMSQEFLSQALNQLIDTDFKIKSGQADKKFLLDITLIKLSGIK
ncbi:DNA polymerase III subunit delta [Lactococcus hodotermopsidis]|uniref:DNA polymerase III subunit delta n=1 Tax=Pseudolactococcus hodotermopsidis TaxID=2709157 RepID=A0A6A0BBP1_9LACT|nr:DNA polymerase III subunit delta [Lactococcus hodotermopsidis]GFH42256.1 DNA polymerase III subunit delta [Lactococcus hodotermopsidis]